MPTAKLSRTLAVAQKELWEVISDPHHIPRWWPGVERVEGVEGDHFTKVFKTKAGRAIRADFTVIDSRPPWLLAWEQQIPGTPFERVLNALVIELRLEPADGGAATQVTIAEMQKLRGYSRTGGFMMSRSTRARLKRALDGLEQIAG